MSDGWGNPIVGGTTLRIPAIESPNFVTQVSGWQIKADGSAEFNSVAVRGSFLGTQFLINSQGAFFYSGAPALGNLAVSIAGAAGTDPSGNVFPAGVWAYGASGGRVGMVNLSGQAEVQMLPAGVTNSTVAPSLFAQAQNAGLANERMLTVIASGKESGNADAAIQFFSAPADNSVAAQMVMEFGGAIAATVTAALMALNVPVQPGNGSTPGARVWSGSGAPAISATAGDMYIRTNGGAGTYLYRCTGGSTWTAFA